MAAIMAIFLFSMIGMPLTAGFAGKFYLFLGALWVKSAPPMGHLYQVLALIGAVNAAISAYYYMHIVGVMFVRGSFQPPIPVPVAPVLIAIVVLRNRDPLAWHLSDADVGCGAVGVWWELNPGGYRNANIDWEKTMGLSEAVVSILEKASEPFTPQEIRDRIKVQYPDLYGTESHVPNVEKGHYHDLDHARARADLYACRHRQSVQARQDPTTYAYFARME